MKGKIESIVKELFELKTTDRFLEKMIYVLAREMKAEHGYVFLKTGDAEYTSVFGWKEKEAKVYSKSVLERVISEKKPVLIHDAGKELDLSESTVVYGFKSIIALPIFIDEQSMAVLYFDSTINKGLFTEEDLHIIESLLPILKLAITNSISYHSLLREEASLRLKLKGLSVDFVTENPSLISVLEYVKKISAFSLPVLITGESGTGKELIATLIHLYSGRRGPFIPVNCGAIPAELLESEMFGYVKGAFTGATRDKKGLIDAASGGTLFLDEITEMPVKLQVKLLRFLDSGTVRKIGETEGKIFDVRVVTASNRDVEISIKEGGFREDLFYRLNVLRINLPPLRERYEDIALLAHYFARKYFPDRTIEFSESAVKKLRSYNWPGNIREFESVITRSILNSQGTGNLKDSDIVLPSASAMRKIKEEFIPLYDFEKNYIRKVLEYTGGNKKEAAHILGISERGLRYKLARWQIDESSK